LGAPPAPTRQTPAEAAARAPAAPRPPPACVHGRATCC
jgi:hypothetical protein